MSKERQCEWFLCLCPASTSVCSSRLHRGPARLPGRHTGHVHGGAATTSTGPSARALVTQSRAQVCAGSEVTNQHHAAASDTCRHSGAGEDSRRRTDTLLCTQTRHSVCRETYWQRRKKKTTRKNKKTKADRYAGERDGTRITSGGRCNSPADRADHQSSL